jgi:hypothetical protein
MILFICADFIRAQENQLQVNTGLRLVNVFQPPSNDNYPLVGYSVGFSYNRLVNSRMFLSLGLNIDEKGYGIKTDIYTETLDSKVKMYYLDLPIKFNYMFLINNDNITMGLGPYVGYGLWGNITSEYGEIKETKDVKWGNNGGDYNGSPDHKRLDIGLTGSITYQINRFSIGLDYQVGFLDMVSDGLGGGEKNNSFGLKIGYLMVK